MSNYTTDRANRQHIPLAARLADAALKAEPESLQVFQRKDVGFSIQRIRISLTEIEETLRNRPELVTEEMVEALTGIAADVRTQTVALRQAGFPQDAK